MCQIMESILNILNSVKSATQWVLAQFDVGSVSVPIELSSTQCGLGPLSVAMTTLYLMWCWSGMCPHRTILNPVL